MKKQLLKSALIGVAAVGLFAGSAMAYSFEDMIDTWGEVAGVPVDARLIVEGIPFSYSHNINDSVNFAAGHYVTEAFLELDFTNDIDDSYKLTGFVKWDYREFVKIAFDGNDWIEIGEVDDDQYQLVLDIDWLNDDGILDVTINVANPGPWYVVGGTAGAWLDHSRLYGTAVPEPTTMLLFGTGLAGLAAFGRRKVKK